MTIVRKTLDGYVTEFWSMLQGPQLFWQCLDLCDSAMVFQFGVVVLAIKRPAFAKIFYIWRFIWAAQVSFPLSDFVVGHLPGGLLSFTFHSLTSLTVLMCCEALLQRQALRDFKLNSPDTLAQWVTLNVFANLFFLCLIMLLIHFR